MVNKVQLSYRRSMLPVSSGWTKATQTFPNLFSESKAIRTRVSKSAQTIHHCTSWEGPVSTSDSNDDFECSKTSYWAFTSTSVRPTYNHAAL